MNVAHHITRPQSSLRTVLLLAGAVIMIIVGLLGMHTFSADAAGHGAPGAQSASTSITPDHADAMVAPSETGHTAPCDDVCLTGSGGGHSEMMTACVLALLAGLLLLIRPLLVDRLGSPLMVLVSALQVRAGRVRSRAPSLIFLSISRT